MRAAHGYDGAGLAGSERVTAMRQQGSRSPSHCGRSYVRLYASKPSNLHSDGPTLSWG